MFSPLSVQGPMARTVEDVALFLDTMAGFCPLDPMTFDAPTGHSSESVQKAVLPDALLMHPLLAARQLIRRQGRLQPNLWSILNLWA